MNKIKKIGIVAVLALALTLSSAAPAVAGLTLDSASVVSSAALTLTSADASAITIGGAAQTGTITLGRNATGTTSTVNIDSANGTAATGTTNIGGGTSTTSGGKIVNIANGIPGGSTTNAVAIGSAGTTTGTVGITIGSVGAAAHTTAIRGGNGATAITLTPEATAGQIVIGAAAGQGAISIGTSSAAQTVNIASGAAAKTINIGTGNTSGVVTIGGTSQTAATTIYGGSTTNAVQINANIGAVSDAASTGAHGLDVVVDGELSSSDQLVGVNVVLTPTGTGGTWASAVYGQAVQTSSQSITGYMSGGEFEVKNTVAGATNEIHALVLDSNNSAAYHGNSSYIWVQDFGAGEPQEMPNLFKITGATDATGNMVYGSTIKLKVNAANQYLVMSDTENKLDLGDSSGGIDVGTATTGIALTGTQTTGISVGSASLTDAIKISATTPVDGLEISSACSANAINVSGASVVGIDLNDSITTTGIDIGSVPTGISFTGDYTTAAIQLGATGAGAITLAEAADHAMDVWTTNSLTSGTVRSVDITQTHTGAGSIAEALTSTLVSNVALGSWGNAIFGKIDFSTNGKVTGQAGVICSELTLPGSSTGGAGTYATYQAEINCPASYAGGAPINVFDINSWGDEKAQFDTTGYLFDISGTTAGDNTKMITSTTLTDDLTAETDEIGIRVKIDGTAYYLLAIPVAQWD